MFGPNLPKKCIYGRKWRKWISPLIFEYSNKSRKQISTSTGNFDFLDQICSNSVFLAENIKNKLYYRILQIRISLGKKFQLNLKILIFKLNLCKNSISDQKQKSEHHHWVLNIRISLGTKFQLKLKTLIFWRKFAQKGYVGLKTEKSEDHFWILHFQIRLGA